jgi:hypothetical protein
VADIVAEQNTATAETLAEQAKLAEQESTKAQQVAAREGVTAEGTQPSRLPNWLPSQ